MSSVSVPREVWTCEAGSMAAETAATRWPRIVQDMVNAVAQTLHDGSFLPEERHEGEEILLSLKQLKAELEQDEPLRSVLPRLFHQRQLTMSSASQAICHRQLPRS